MRAQQSWLCCAVFGSLLAQACGNEGRPSASGQSWEDVNWSFGDGGPRLSAGQSCEDDGAQIECGKITERHGDYVTCSLGVQTCEGGLWGECRGTRFTQKEIPKSSGVRMLALGSSATCPAGFDPCDPYCNQIVDTPGGFVTSPNISNTPSGVTPLPTGVGNCTELTLTPSTSKLTVTSLTSLPAPVTFTLTAAPAGCADDPFVTTWTVDKLDRASMSSSTSTSNGGRLTLAVPIAGPLKVTAFAHGLNISTTILVNVNVVDRVTSSAAATALGIPTGLATTSAFADLFGTTTPLAGTTASTASWLYPYADTYFPLGLPAPTLQYRYASGAGKAVKVSLRYPKNVAPADATFNYSIIVSEANVVSRTAGVAANTIDPQVVVPQAAWEYFESAARDDDADLIVQRLSASLEYEKRQTIHFVDGQLKGTVYYNSYTSPQGNNTGAVLSIAPGAQQPTIAVQPAGKCTVCHSIDLYGKNLIANGARTTNTTEFNQSRLFDLTNVPSAGSPSIVRNYNDSVSGDFSPGDYDIIGDRFTFGAPWLDGSLYLSHGGWPAYGGDGNWRAPNNYSWFYLPSDTNSASKGVTIGNWNNISAVTPRFSPTGDKVAFGFWGNATSTLPCSSNALTGFGKPCSGSSSKVMSPASAGTRLVVMDFKYPSSASVTNARDVTPGVTHPVAWPSFTPDGSSVLYQRQYRTSKSGTGGVLSGGWSPSGINTVAGALAEIWMSKVPADGSSTVVPTQLKALNGLSASGTSYLPQFPNADSEATSRTMTQTVTSGSAGPALTITDTNPNGGWHVMIDITVGGTRSNTDFRYSTNQGYSWSSSMNAGSSVSLGSTGLTVSFPSSGTYNANSTYKVVMGSFHENNASYTVAQADNCGNTGSSTGVNDYQLNYLPAVAPTEAGGYNWVVFTSRRMFGNVATDNPWDAEPTETCHSDTPPTKKLWIAAVDKNWVEGTDPSHPAFYFPGQELKAGNSNGYWVNEQCGGLGASCESDDDCCGGTGADPTTQCGIVSTATVPPTRQCQAYSACSAVGEDCTTDSDCCTGLVCPDGGGECVSLPAAVYEVQSFEREYESSCPYGTYVSWRFFEWQATIPSGASIDFAVQTKELATDAYSPAVALPMATASASTPTGSWERGATTAGDVLSNAGHTPAKYLRVTITFNPNATGTAAPTLLNWRQVFDCMPAQ